MDKMNEGSDASAFVKTDVKFWITRERGRERVYLRRCNSYAR